MTMQAVAAPSSIERWLCAGAAALLAAFAAGAEAQVQLCAPQAATGGRRRLQGRLLEIVGERGAERVRMQLLADDAAKAGTSGPGARVRKPAAGKRPVGKVGAEEGAIVEFALADVEKAKLVPELNFRSGARSKPQ